MKKEDHIDNDTVNLEDIKNTENETLTKEQELDQKLQEANDKYMRLYSEFDNYRKRTAKEKADLIKYADENILKVLLPFIDDIERALQSINTSNRTLDADGIQLIYNKLMGSLNKKGLQPIEAKGQKFDENFHEAVTKFPASSPDETGIVLDEIEKGYMLNDKVIRYAKVVVAI